eukprot:7264679-Alexandrium_andersonii.AAC.1
MPRCVGDSGLSSCPNVASAWGDSGKPCAQACFSESSEIRTPNAHACFSEIAHATHASQRSAHQMHTHA